MADLEERRRRRRVRKDHLEEKSASRAGSVRSSAIQKGILVQEVDQGVKCLKCGPACPGYEPHVWKNKCKNCDCEREEHDLDLEVPENRRPIRQSDLQQNGSLSSHNKDGEIMVNFSLQMNHDPKENDADEMKVSNVSYKGKKFDPNNPVITNEPAPKQNGQMNDVIPPSADKKGFTALDEFQQFIDELEDFEKKVCEPNPHAQTINIIPANIPQKKLAVPVNATTDKKKSRRRRKKAPQRGSNSDPGSSSSESEDEREKRKSTGVKHDEEREKKSKATVKIKVEDSKVSNKKKSPQRLTPADLEDLAQEFAWIPSGLSKDKVRKYMKSLPADKVPRLGTPGEDYHDRQLLYQLPPQDSNLSLCHCVPENLKHVYSEFVEKQSQAQGPGIVEGPLGSYEVCLGCREAILTGELAVRAPKFDENAFWHTRCFCCSTCGELLVDLIYYNSNGKIYCGRHNAETFKPRCADCEELIFADSYIRALNKTWHYEHFKCGGCRKTITGQEYIVFEDKALCVDCYYHKVAKVCSGCSDKIGPDSKKVTNGDRFWHEGCFICEECRTPLTTDGKFTLWEEKILCVRCHSNKNPVKKCHGCSESFKPGSSRLEYNGNFWHENCFCCQICNTSIGTQAFVPKDEGILCQDCYTNTYAKRCGKCQEPVVGSGVMYNDQTWHRKCFVCFNCSTSIASCEFSVRDDNKYCSECYSKLFAKKCEGCNQAIIGGEYCRLEETYYHKDCFLCFRCGASLVERGFYREDDEYICDGCLKD